MLFSHMRQHWLLEHIQHIVTRTNSIAPDIQPLIPNTLLPLPHSDKHDPFTQILTTSSNIFQHYFYLALHLQQYVSLLYWCEQLSSLEWESGACKSMALGSWHDTDPGADFSLYTADWVDHGVITEQINAFPPEDSCFHWITKLAQNCNTGAILQMALAWGSGSGSSTTAAKSQLFFVKYTLLISYNFYSYNCNYHSCG